MKVLYLSYDGMTDQLGQSQVLPYLIGLSNLGHTFHLVSFEKEDRFQKEKHRIEDLLNGTAIIWVPIRYHKNPPVISTIIDLIALKKKVDALQVKHQFDIVHCRSYITALAGLSMKKKYGLKFIFDMRGFYADERVDGGIWNLSNPVFKSVYKYFKRKEAEFLRNADAIISLTYAAEAIMQNWKLKPGKLPITVIPCCADLDLFDYNNVDHSSLHQIRNQLQIKPEQFVLTYLGAIGTWYLLDEMLDFFSVLLTYLPHAVFLFVTNENAEEILKRLPGKNILPQSVRIVSAKRDEVPLYLGLSNYSIFYIMSVFSKKASSPTKQAEIMGMGVPLICNSGIGDTDLVVNKFASGLLTNCFTATHYNEAVKKIVSGYEFSKNKIRAGAIEFYSLKTGVKRYNEVYLNVKNQ